jgi:hypothetical protein
MSMQQLKQCLPLDNVGLVKLDCEGCEFEVVPSNTPFFSTSRARVVGESCVPLAGARGGSDGQSLSDKVIRDVKVTSRHFCAIADVVHIEWLHRIECVSRSTSREKASKLQYLKLKLVVRRY